MSAAAAMTPREKFLFDLNGFLVIRGVFTPEEIASANAAVDNHKANLMPRGDGLKNTKAGTPLAATGPRNDMGGMLYWPKEQSSTFREVLTHTSMPMAKLAFRDLSLARAAA